MEDDTRAELEQEFLSYLAEKPKKRSKAILYGVDNSWFADPVNQRIWHLITNTKGKLTEAVLRAQGAPLWDQIETSTNFNAIYTSFKESVLLSDIETALGDVGAKLGTATSENLLAFLDKAFKPVHEKANHSIEGNDFLENLEAVWENYLEREASDEEAKVTGLPYPWYTPNLLTSGMQAEELIVFYGHPKAMKTWLLMAMAKHLWWEHEYCVLVTSKEMSNEILRKRLAAMIARVDYGRLNAGMLTESERKNFRKAIKGMLKLDQEVPIFTSPIKGMGAAAVACLREEVRKLDPDVVFVDSANELGRKWEEHEETNAALKNLAQEFGIPVVVTCQANRALNRAAKDSKVPAEQDISGHISWIRKADAVFRTTKIAENRLSLEMASMRETREEKILLKACPAIHFDEIKQGNEFEVSDAPSFLS